MISQDSNKPSSVLVVHGAASDRFDIAGVTIGEIRRQLRNAFNIPGEADAFLNGEQVNDDVALKDQDKLEFVKVHGRKGGLPDFLSENELVALFGESNFRLMQKAGLRLSPNPTISMEEVREWSEWVQDKNTPLKRFPLSVCVEEETITYKGKTYYCDRSFALVLQCLLNAGGEVRSTVDIRRSFPSEPFEERLDRFIKRQLERHPSQIGDVIESIRTKGYRLAIERLE